MWYEKGGKLTTGAVCGVAGLAEHASNSEVSTCVDCRRLLRKNRTGQQVFSDTMGLFSVTLTKNAGSPSI